MMSLKALKGGKRNFVEIMEIVTSFSLSIYEIISGITAYREAGFVKE